MNGHVFGLIFRDDAAEFTNWKFRVSAYSQVNTVYNCMSVYISICLSICLLECQFLSI